MEMDLERLFHLPVVHFFSYCSFHYAKHNTKGNTWKIDGCRVGVRGVHFEPEAVAQRFSKQQGANERTNKRTNKRTTGHLADLAHEPELYRLLHIQSCLCANHNLDGNPFGNIAIWMDGWMSMGGWMDGWMVVDGHGWMGWMGSQYTKLCAWGR